MLCEKGSKVLDVPEQSVARELRRSILARFITRIEASDRTSCWVLHYPLAYIVTWTPQGRTSGKLLQVDARVRNDLLIFTSNRLRWKLKDVVDYIAQPTSLHRHVTAVFRLSGQCHITNKPLRLPPESVGSEDQEVVWHPRVSLEGFVDVLPSGVQVTMWASG